MNTALRFSRIKPEQYPQLLIQIQHILTEVGAHNVAIYNQAYWNWQYLQLPTQESYVYAAWDADKIIGYYHVPIYTCSINGVEKRIGTIQDVAVNPTYRGMGLFKQLAVFANNDLDQANVDLIYTFPNEKSIRTFLKYNDFKVVATVPTFVRPVASAAIIRSKVNLFGAEKALGFVANQLVNLFTKNIKRPHATIEVITEITDEVEAVFATYASSFQNYVLRDKAWLRWRYVQSVRGKHHLLALREAGKITAVAVVKEDQMLGNPALLIMDFAHLHNHENALLYLISSLWKQPERIAFKFHLLFVSGLAPALAEFRKIGFLSVPEKANPRVLNVLSRSSSNLNAAPLQKKKNWLLTLGDWDVF